MGRDRDGEGNGSDTTTYFVGAAIPDEPLTVSAELLYQSLQPEFVDHLLMGKTPAASRFKRYYEAADRRPEVVQAVTRRVPDRRR